jgi:hypothetical protein
MNDTLNYLKPWPSPIATTMERSAIEIHFPRIAQEICTRWLTDAIDPFMDSLLIDNRGDRRGFPAEVQEELMFLSGLRWHLQHEDKFVQEFQKPDPFSFEAMNESDIRRCGTTGSWVLL